MALALPTLPAFAQSAKPILGKLPHQPPTPADTGPGSWILDYSQSTQDSFSTGTQTDANGNSVLLVSDYSVFFFSALGWVSLNENYPTGTMTSIETQFCTYVWASGTDGDGIPIHTSNPPKKAYFRLTGTAYNDIGAGGPASLGTLLGEMSSLTCTADDGLGDPPTDLVSSIYDGYDRGYYAHLAARPISTGKRLVAKDGSSGTVTFNFTSTAHCEGTLGNSDLAEDVTVCAGPVDVQQDSRGLSLHRDGAHDEWTDSDGNTHGDTIYSYTNTYWSEYPEGENEDNVDNWQYFHPAFAGSWTANPNYPIPDLCLYDITWSWNPSESSDTWDTGKWRMPYGSLNMKDGDWVGTPTGTSPDSPMTYTATDNGDSATAMATYILKVHDPVEWDTTPVTSDADPALIGSCDHPVSAGSDVVVTYPPPSGTMNYSDGAKIFSIVTAGVSSIPVEGGVPQLAMILLSSISATAGSYAPNTPYDQKTLSSSEGDFSSDVSTQVNIDSGNTNGIPFSTTPRITGANTSDVAADPQGWYDADPTVGYWTVTGQVTEYRKNAWWLAQTYDAGGHTGAKHSTANFRTRIGDGIRTWTFNPVSH